MATSLIFSGAQIGYDGRLIEIECDSSNGLPTLVIVGLGNKAIDESKERIRSTIKNSGLEFPRKRITLNLAPADLPKDGASYDLPMALAVLLISQQVPPDSLQEYLIVGELSLDGKIKPVRGIIGYIETARRNGFTKVIIPRANAAQASLIHSVELIAVDSLRELYGHLTGRQIVPAYHASSPLASLPQATVMNISSVSGQDQAKRALIVAAAGHHNILLNGPPGSGKTMLAKTILSLLPSPSVDEIIAITKLHSLAGESQNEAITERPFRSPHHTASHVALIGGGGSPRPGEISLAHHGVLFLDELPEYPRMSLEALRQPLEDRQVHIARAHHRVTYPADFMLVATQNPCPCGFMQDPIKECICTPQAIARYQKKLSGPLLDRIDLLVTVTRVEHSELLSQKNEISMTAVRDQIARAQQRQNERFRATHFRNAHLSHLEIQQKASLRPKAKSLLDKASASLSLSARVYMKMIRVARTIADLDDCDSIETQHISEALQYRQH